MINKWVDEEVYYYLEGVIYESIFFFIFFDNVEIVKGVINVDGIENDLGNVVVVKIGGMEDGGIVVEEEVGIC